MTFDESNAAITNELTGREIEHVIRNGKILEIVTACGHVIKLQADINGDIHYRGTEVRIVLPAALSVGSIGSIR